MTPTREGSFRLFQFSGIVVYLHWSWFLAAVLLFNQRSQAYSSAVWNGLEYLALFGIVLLHEFGHALACRSVGGQADQIVLWPLGGVAYVNPPPRPGPTLWSIAAGPLVNVLLLPITAGLLYLSNTLGWPNSTPDVAKFVTATFVINLSLLVFNMLPVYPLDGGQILRALLWFVVGRAKSLMVATVIGLAAVIGVIVLVVINRSQWFGIWFAIMAFFILMNCWRGLVHARALLRLDKMPRHDNYACPHCQTSPPRGAFWICGQCRTPFDTFDHQATCPSCHSQFAVTGCLECGRSSPLSDWLPPIPSAQR